VASVSVREVSKRFAHVDALKGVSIDVDDGEFFCLLGPSGAGKTTLMRCIAGLETLDAGDVLIDGRPVVDVPPSQRNVAMVFESYALYPHMTVIENLMYPLRERRVPTDEARRRAERVAATLGIEHVLGRLPSTCSGGEMQRVAIGRAIVRPADVYLFDEPLSNLDAQLRDAMRAELKRLHQEMGSTLIYATPDQLEALTMADRIAVLKEGSVVEIETPERIYFDPKRLFTASYVGDPPMNLLPITVRGDGTVTADWLAGARLNRSLPAGGCQIGFRPEDVRFGEAYSANSADGIEFRASIYAVEPCGDYEVVTLAAGTHHVKAIAPAGSSHRAGGGSVHAWASDDRIYAVDPASEQMIPRSLRDSSDREGRERT